MARAFKDRVWKDKAFRQSISTRNIGTSQRAPEFTGVKSAILKYFKMLAAVNSIETAKALQLYIKDVRAMKIIYRVGVFFQGRSARADYVMVAVAVLSSEN